MSDTPAKVKKNEVVSYDISDSQNTLALATELTSFIKDKGLITKIKGKEFLNVEAWMYAGSRLGIVPIVDDLINESTSTEVKYRATVTLKQLGTDRTVGRGIAVCSNKEDGKKFFQEFAIASMAQTRAIGKAYRMLLGWLITAAGYSPASPDEAEYETAQIIEEKEDTELVTLRTDLIRKIDNPVITNSERAYIMEKIPDFNKDAVKRWIVKFDKLIIDRAKEAEAV